MNWKLILLVLIVFAGVYYFFFLPKVSEPKPLSTISFDNAFQQAEQLRSSAGVKFKPTDEELLTYSDEKLDAFTSGLRSLRNQWSPHPFNSTADRSAALDLIDLHIAYVEIVRARRIALESQQNLPPLTDFDQCPYLDKFESLQSATADLIGLALSFNAQLRAFDQEHSAQSVIAQTQLYYSDEAVLQDSLQSSQTALNQLRLDCA